MFRRDHHRNDEPSQWLARTEPSAVRSFLRMFLPLALLMAGTLGAYHYVESARARESLIATERARLSVAETFLASELDTTLSDLHLLARNDNLHRLLDTADADARSGFIKELSNHLEEIGNYDYIALFDANGQEIIRVKGTTGIPIMGASSPSPPTGREFAFVNAMLKEKQTSTHISTPLLEATGEHSRLWPTLLFAISVHGASPRAPKGVLVISYPIATLTTRLDSLLTDATGHVSILNEKGFWIYDQSRGENEWGNMFQNGPGFAETHAGQWRKFTSAPAGLVPDGDGAYLFTSLYPFGRQRSGQSSLPADNDTVAWKVISHLDNDSLQIWKQRIINDIPLYLLVLGGLGMAMWHRAQSRVQQKLTDEATRLAAKVMDSRAAGIFIAETDGRMVAVNPTFLSLTGYTQIELLHQKKPLFAFSPATGQMEFWQGILEYLDNRDEWEGEVICRRRNGSTFPCSLLVGVIHNQTNHPSHFVVIASDITQRKQAENVLRESQERFRQLVEQAFDAIFVISINGKIQDANRLACKSLGYLREELTQLYVWDIDPIYPPEKVLALHHHMQPGVAQTIQGMHRRKDGSTFPVEIRVGLSLLGGEAQVIAMVRDISERLTAEQALRASQERLARAQQLAHLGNWEWDARNDQITWSEEAVRILGHTPPRDHEQFLAMVHPDDQKRVQASVESIAQRQAMPSDDFRIILPDGSIRYLHTQSELRHDNRTNTSTIIGTIQDITERKLAEEALRASHEMFVTVMDSMEAVVYVADMSTYEILFANRYTQKVFGQAQLPGKFCWQVIQQGQSSPCPYCNNDLLLAPDGQPGESISWEFRNETSNRWYHVIARAISWMDGRIVRLEIATDITSLKETENALRHSQANLAMAQSIAHIGNWEWDIPENRTYWSDEIYRIAGQPVPAEGESGWHNRGIEFDLDAIHPEDRDRIHAALQEALQGQAPYFVEFRIVRPTGEIRHISGIGEIQRDAASKPLRMFGILQDITERKQMETLQDRHQRELEHASRLSIIGEMSSGLAHELSQPLSATQNYIRGSIRRLQSGNIEPEQLLNALQLAALQSERAAGIIARIKEFINKREPEKTPLDIQQLTREVLLLLEQELRLNRITVHEDFPAAAPPHVIADKVEIEQVMVNLIKNAIEAMRDSEQREIRIGAHPRQGGQMEIIVADTGPGIPEGLRDNIFNPFFSTKKDGMGLGLAISHSIIEAHGGRLWATSGSEGGTVFHFTLSVESGS